MNAEYVKKLALPEEVKEIYPVTAEMNKAVETTKQEVAKVIEGFSDKLVLINLSRTSMDGFANLCIYEDCEKVAKALFPEEAGTV